MRRLLIALLVFASACTADVSTPTPDNNPRNTINPPISGNPPVGGSSAQVTRIIDGDTIDVEIGGVGYRVRYIGVNTPERDEACYQEATDADAALVSGKTVTLVKDTSDTDQYGRLLRYVYVGNTFVNAELVRQGWAENAVYPPDTQYEDTFHQLELQARQANIGCHPTGIFNDGSDTR